MQNVQSSVSPGTGLKTTAKVWREHAYFVTNAISQTQLNMYFKTKM